MQALNYPRAYTQAGGAAANIPRNRPARSAALSVTANGDLSFDGSTDYPIFWATLTNSSAVPKDDAEIIATLQVQVAEGFNGVRLRNPMSHYWTQSSSNWGLWKYANNDATPANRWLLEEAGLVQLDKMVEWALDAGHEAVYIDLEGYDEAIIRHISGHAPGSYQGRGMQWSDEYRDIIWECNRRIVTRVNTLNSKRYCDDRRIIWLFDNENGFSDCYTRGANTWGGSSAMRRFAKIINSVTDSFGDNGYWRPELCDKFQTWASVNGFTIPGGWAGCLLDQDAFDALTTGTANKNAVLDFLDDIDYEHNVDILTRLRAENDDTVFCTGTWSYTSQRSHIALPAHLAKNILHEKHHYFSDADSVGVKTTSARTRKSVMNSSWSYATGGAQWNINIHANHAPGTHLLAGECGQYGPNAWRWERLAYESVLACLHGYGIADYARSQQHVTSQFLTDGAYMGADAVNIGSPTSRLMATCVAPIIKYRFFARFSTDYTISQTKATMRAYQHANVTTGFEGAKYNAAFSGSGYQHGHWGGKRMLLKLDEAASPTTDFSGYPNVSAGTMTTGYYVRGTKLGAETEKIWVRHDHGMQAMSPYCCIMAGDITDTPDFVMPLRVRSLSATVTKGYMCARSNWLAPLFTAPWQFYILGSDFSTKHVNRGAAGAASGGVGAATFMATDESTIYTDNTGTQTWVTDGGPSDSNLMMPEALTVDFDSNGAPAPYTGLEQEIYKIDKNGLPTRVASTFAAGVTSIAYDASSPQYIGQPKAAVATSIAPRRGRWR